MADGGSWVQATPGGFLGGAHRLVVDPADGAVLLFVQSAEIHHRELWALDGDRFVPEATGVLSGYAWQRDLFALFAAPDPANRDALLFGRRADGVVLTRRSDLGHQEVWRWDGPDEVKVFAAGWLAGRLHFLAEDGTVLAERDGRLETVAEALEPYDPDANRGVWFQSALMDPVHQRILAFGAFRDGQCWEFTLDGGWRRGRAAPHQRVGLAWHPEENRAWVCVGDFGGLDAKEMEVRPYDDLDPPPDTPIRIRSRSRALLQLAPPLAFDAARRHWLYLDPRLRLHRASTGEKFQKVTPPLQLQDERTAPSAPHDVEPVYVYEARDRGLNKLIGDRYTRIASLSGVATAGSDGGYRLSALGALYHVAADGTERRLAPPWGGLGSLGPDGNDPLRSAYARLVADPASDQLVLWHGRAGRTWFFHADRWHLGPPGARPPAGPAVLAATPAGVYCASGGELWRLADEQWFRVGPTGFDHPHLLFARRNRPGLWALVPDGLAIWRDGGFHRTVALPDPVVLDEPDEPGVVRLIDRSTTAVHDPVADRVVLWGDSGSWTLSLAAMPTAELPLGSAVEVPPDAATVNEAIADAAAASAYVLEMSAGPGGINHSEWFAYPEWAHIRSCLEQTLGAADPNVRDLYLTVLGAGGAMHLWVVQRGVLAAGIDLRRYVRLSAAAGADPPAVAIDWDGLASMVPPLDEPLLSRRGTVPITLDGPHPDPDVDSHLMNPDAVRFGYTDRERYSRRAPGHFTDPSRPNNRPAATRRRRGSQPSA
jgi:hypothetical protein